MDKRNEVTLNGKRYMVQGTAVCVYCESKVAWRSGWRAVRSAKIAAEVLRVYDKTSVCAEVLCDIKSEFEYLGVRDFGASGLSKQLEQRVNAHYLNAVKALDAIAKLQAIAKAQGEYA